MRQLALPRNPSIADFGCGNGFITARIAHLTRAAEVHGYDLTATQLDEGRRRYAHIAFHEIDLNSPQSAVRMPRFDLVTCFETIEHVGSPFALLSNLMAALKPTGVALVTMPIEVGLIGLAKFLAKTVIAAAPPRPSVVTSELSRSPGTWARYALTLMLGGNVAGFRDTRNRWGTHLGFDWRRIKQGLDELGVEFEGRTVGTTRLYRISSKPR